MNRRERTVRGKVSSEHQVHLFDDTESLAETVAGFLCEGWQRDEPVLVVARPENWVLVARELAASGCPLDDVMASGRFVVLDAAATLASLLFNGRPVAERFHEVVGTLVGRLHDQFGNRVRIYGEMVDILAAQDDFASAGELERLWNVLGTTYSFTLLCGYASGHFGDPRTKAILREICAAHDHAVAKPSDLLGSWLLADRRSRLHTTGAP